MIFFSALFGGYWLGRFGGNVGTSFYNRSIACIAVSPSTSISQVATIRYYRLALLRVFTTTMASWPSLFKPYGESHAGEKKGQVTATSFEGGFIA